MPQPQPQLDCFLTRYAFRHGPRHQLQPHCLLTGYALDTEQTRQPQPQPQPHCFLHRASEPQPHCIAVSPSINTPQPPYTVFFPPSVTTATAEAITTYARLSYHTMNTRYYQHTVFSPRVSGDAQQRHDVLVEAHHQYLYLINASQGARDNGERGYLVCAWP